MSVENEEIFVDVDGEVIKYTIYVDKDTGLDVDPTSGQFRSRAETEEHLRSVYRVGRDTMRTDLERYNKWIRGEGKGKGDKLFTRPPSGLSGSVQSTRKAKMQQKKKEVDESMTKEERQFAAVRCKNSGNTALQERNFRKAISYYDDGLALDPHNAVLHSNKSEALIRLRRYPDALQCAEDSMALAGEGGSHQEKAHFRKLTCLINLRKRAEAVSLCQSALQQKLRFKTSNRSMWEEKLAEAHNISLCRWNQPSAAHRTFRLIVNEHCVEDVTLKDCPVFLSCSQPLHQLRYHEAVAATLAQHFFPNTLVEGTTMMQHLGHLLSTFLEHRLPSGGGENPAVATSLGNFFTETSLPAALTDDAHLKMAAFAAECVQCLQKEASKSSKSSVVDLPPSLEEELLCCLLLLQQEMLLITPDNTLVWVLGLHYLIAHGDERRNAKLVDADGQYRVVSACDMSSGERVSLSLQEGDDKLLRTYRVDMNSMCSIESVPSISQAEMYGSPSS